MGAEQSWGGKHCKRQGWDKNFDTKKFDEKKFDEKKFDEKEFDEKEFDKKNSEMVLADMAWMMPSAQLILIFDDDSKALTTIDQKSEGRSGAPQVSDDEVG